MDGENLRAPTQQEIDEESRQLRRLRIAVNLALSIIAQGMLPIEEAYELIAATRRMALGMFPEKEAVYDLIYTPKFRRLINEVYRLS